MRHAFATPVLCGVGAWLLLLACTSAEAPTGSDSEAQAAARVSQAEWLAQTAPRAGVHEIWSEACNGTRIDQAYRVVPAVGCGLRRDANGQPTDTFDCSVEDYCQSAADCTAKAGGVCRGVAATQCVYADFEQGQLCDRDADCDQLPAGNCMPRLVGGGTFCYPTGECRSIPLRGCVYPSLYSNCQSDADCVAAPGGYCQFLISPTECVYNECDGDASCGSNARCECQYLNRCLPADCFSDADCSAGFRCESSLAVQCGNLYPPVAYHCHNARDECQSDTDCAGFQSCVFDPSLDLWACGTFDCLTR